MYEGTRPRHATVAAGLRLLRGGSRVRLRPAADGADGRELPRRGAAREFMPRLLAWHQLIEQAVDRVRRAVRAGPAGLGARHLRLDHLVLDRHGGQHGAGHRRRARPPARGARGRGDPAARRIENRRAQDHRTAEADMNDRTSPAQIAERLALTAGDLPRAAHAAGALSVRNRRAASRGFRRARRRALLVRAVRRSRPVARVSRRSTRSPTRTCCKGVVPWLSQHFRVVVMDLRGNGRSDRPAVADAYSLRPLLRRFRRGARPARGRPRGRWSASPPPPMIALRLAAEQPQRVSHLVIAGGYPERPMHDPAAAKPCQRAPADARRLAGLPRRVLRHRASRAAFDQAVRRRRPAQRLAPPTAPPSRWA